jgi:hypothetical protein
MREQLIPIDAINADGHKPLFLSLKNIDQYFCDKTSGEGCRSQHFGSSKRDTFTLECPRRIRKTSKKLIENDADLNRQNEEIFNVYVFDVLYFKKINQKPLKFIENVKVILNSELRDDAVKFFQTARTIVDALDALVPSVSINSLIYCLLSYGMDLCEADLHTIYKMYGYSDFFEILLFIEVRFNLHEFLYRVHPVVLMIHDVILNFI